MLLSVGGIPFAYMSEQFIHSFGLPFKHPRVIHTQRVAVTVISPEPPFIGTVETLGRIGKDILRREIGECIAAHVGTEPQQAPSSSHIC